MTKEAVIAIYTLTEPSYIADYIIQNMYLKPEKKQLILETAAPVKRLELVCDILMREIDVIEIEQRIDERLRGRLERQRAIMCCASSCALYSPSLVKPRIRFRNRRNTEREYWR